MAVTFILGRAGSGKTRYCVDAVLRALADPDDDRRQILLVPEQASFQMERALATRSPVGGYMRAEVLSFSRLATRVFDELGAEPPFIRRGARTLALRAVVARQSETLQVFGAAARTPGFFAHLDRVIEELLTEGVMPEELAEAVDRLDDDATRRKTREIAALYAAYLDWLGPTRVDPALRLRLLGERLQRVDWLRGAAVWVDGFAGFTGQELHALVALARLARETHLTLLCDPRADLGVRPPGELDLFRRTAETQLQLRALFENAGVDVASPILLDSDPPPRFKGVPGLATLERVLGGAAPQPAASSQGVRVVECETHRDELRQAARYIRQSVIESQGRLHYRDFAIITRDLDVVADDATAILDEYAIPHFLDRRQPMRGHPLSRFVHALLDAVQNDLPASAMLRLLRTELLPLSREESEALQNTLLENDARGAAYWRQDAWEVAGDRAFVPESRPRRQRRVDTRDARLRLMSGLDALLTLAGGDAPASGAAWSAALYDALQALEVPRTLQRWIRQAQADGDWRAQAVHQQAWSELCVVLDDLHDVLGASELSASEARDIVTAAVSDVTLGLAPPTLDQVLVSAIERSRHPDIRCAWVMAFNEGVFPARPRDELVFTAQERAELKSLGLAAPQPHVGDAFDERLLAHIAFTRPSESLTISYATSDESGEALPPSPLLEDVLHAVPDLTPTPVDAFAPPMTVAECLRRGYASRDRAGVDLAARVRCDRLREELAADPRWAEEVELLTRGERYANKATRTTPGRVTRDGARQVWRASPSEIETRLQCPFKHYARYLLGLEDDRRSTSIAAELGQLAHDLLEQTTRRAMAAGDVRELADEQWTGFLAEALATREAEWRWRRDDPRKAFLGQLLGRQLVDAVLAHAARWRRGAYRPWLLESRLNDADDGRMLTIDVGGGRVVRLRCIVDRVDRPADGAGGVLIYDYKTSAGSIARPFLTGDRLQLFLYALAIRERENVDVGGVFLAPWRPNMTVVGQKSAQECADDVLRMRLFMPRGLFDEFAGGLLDTQLQVGTSPVASMGRKKDGGRDGRYKDWTTASEVRARLDLAADTVRCAAKGAFDGDASVAPLVESRTLACRMCGFQDVCRFDRRYNDLRLAEATLPMLEGAAEGDDE